VSPEPSLNAHQRCDADETIGIILGQQDKEFTPTAKCPNPTIVPLERLKNRVCLCLLDERVPFGLA
jgi:hypothetical protein